MLPTHDPWPFPSLLGAAPPELGIRLLVLLGAVAAAGLACGARPRSCAAVTFYVLACLNARNPYLLYGAHRLELPLLLAACFPATVERAAIVWVQLACLYGFSAVAKLGDATWVAGDALALAMVAEQAPGTAFALDHPDIGHALTWSVLCLEGAAAPLLFLRRTRVPAAVGLALFHLGATALLSIGWFSAIACVGLAGMVATSTEARAKPPTRWIALGIAAVIVAGNIGAAFPRFRELETPAVTLGIPQGWAMYTGGLHISWPLAVATTATGERVDGWTRDEADDTLAAWSARPTLVGTYLETLLDPRAESLRDGFAAWACAPAGTAGLELLDIDSSGSASLVGRWDCPGTGGSPSR